MTTLILTLTIAGGVFVLIGLILSCRPDEPAGEGEPQENFFDVHHPLRMQREWTRQVRASAADRIHRGCFAVDQALWHTELYGPYAGQHRADPGTDAGDPGDGGVAP